MLSTKNDNKWWKLGRSRPQNKVHIAFVGVVVEEGGLLLELLEAGSVRIMAMAMAIANYKDSDRIDLGHIL
jgi:hypothetical protein